jgi:hypothetical protein
VAEALLIAIIFLIIIVGVVILLFRSGNAKGTVPNKPRDERDKTPAMCEILPIRDFLDNVMVRIDGCYVAGYRIEGSRTYFGSEDDRNRLKDRLDSLLRTCPEESIRVQVRYEVTDTIGHTIDDYEAARRTKLPAAIALDQERVDIWRKKAAAGEYLTRTAAIYFIWSPEAHRRLMAAAGTKMGGGLGSKSLSPGVNACIRKEREEHEAILLQFESLLRGIESSMTSAELSPGRMTHDQLFAEVQDTLGPFCPVRTHLRAHPLATREISAREQLCTVQLQGQTESYMVIDGTLWSVVSMKEPPDRTFPGIIRELQTLGFPLVISTNVDIPNQANVLKLYQRRQKKMISAQTDMRGRPRVDATAAQVEKELRDIQSRIIASSTKACQISLSVAFRTSFKAQTATEFEAAERQIAARRQQIIHVMSRMDGGSALPESIAQLRLLINTLPGLASKDRRESDVLTANAADLMPVEMPWVGTPRTPMILFPTPYRQLIPYSPFDPSHENANAIIAATSGTGKSMLVQMMLLAAGRQDVMVSILERGDSYYHTVKYMGGEMITMSLDSDFTINPFDLEPGQTEPSRDQLSFLKSLIRHMLGDNAITDSDILDNVLIDCILSAYKRASMRTKDKTPLLSDVRDDLQAYIDPNNNEIVIREAQVAAVKLASWVDKGIYASLFDRPTTVNMNVPWLYFNVEKLKDDKKLETAMSLIITYTTTRRAGGGKRCIVVLDECWSLLESPSLRDVVLQLFRTARKRDACVWGISQAVEDFTGTPEKPNPIGGAILATTALRLIGRQKGNLEVLREFLHLSPATIERIKTMGMTEKGKYSEFLICIGERSETTHSLYIQLTPIEYWLATSYPRERNWRKWWLRTHEVEFAGAMQELARKFPQGLAALPEQPEERSGEVMRDISVDRVFSAREKMLAAAAAPLIAGGGSVNGMEARL